MNNDAARIEEFVTSDDPELLLIGKRGMGKTSALIRAFLDGVKRCDGSGYKGFIIVKNHSMIPYVADLAVRLAESECRNGMHTCYHQVEFRLDFLWNGSSLYFRTVDDTWWFITHFLYSYTSFVGFDNIEDFDTSYLYDECKLHSLIYQSALYDNPCRFRSTCSPLGQRKHWIKDRDIWLQAYSKMRRDGKPTTAANGHS